MPKMFRGCLVAALNLSVLVAANGCGAGSNTELSSNAPPSQAENRGSAGAVRFEFNLGEETKTEIIDGVAQGTLLETVMRDLKQVDVVITGSRTTAFVDKIEGKRTDSTGGWTYLVDGEPATQGIGSYQLSPPATVVWRFGDYLSVAGGGSSED